MHIFSFRTVRVGDGEYTVMLTFFDKSLHVVNKLKEGDVVSLLNTQINAYNVNPDVYPASLKYRDYKPMSELTVLVGKKIPKDLLDIEEKAGCLIFSIIHSPPPFKVL